MRFLSRPPSPQKRTLRRWNWLQRSKSAPYSVTKLKEGISQCRKPQELALAANPAKLLKNTYKHTPPNPGGKGDSKVLQGIFSHRRTRTHTEKREELQVQTAIP